MTKYFTKEGLEKLKNELKELETTRMKESAEAIRYAASFGDLSENAAYADAKEEQNKILTRIAEIRGILREVEIIGESKNNNNVHLGSTVVLKADGEVEIYQILGEGEVNLAEGKISYKSPLGEKLIGKNIGDIVELGGKLKYKIIEIK